MWKSSGSSSRSVLAESSLELGVVRRLENLPFDAQQGEVLYLPKTADVKRVPANTLRLTLLSVEASGVREIGSYLYHHHPWAGPASAP